MAERAKSGEKPSGGVADRTTLFLLGVVALVLVGIVLRAAQTVFVPLVIAWLLSQLLGPVVIFLTRRRMPPALAVALVLLLLLIALYWIGVFVSASATSFVNQLPRYRDQMIDLSKDLTARLGDAFPALHTPAVRAEMNQHLSRMVGALVGTIGSAVGMMTTVFANLVMILIILAFMLVERPFFDRKLHRALGDHQARRVGRITRDISRQISGYLSVQFLVSLVTGILVYSTCRVVGIASAVTWGALAFFLNFIPTIGSILAGIPPVMLALLQFYPNAWPAFWTLVAIVAINQVLGNIVTPRLMGDRLNLSPVVILLSLLFWGWLWGFVGALLSVLITASIKILCENIDPLNPIGTMLGSGRR